MMEKSLQERGWYLSADGIEKCKEGLAQLTVDNVIKAALDCDLREIGSPALQELIARGKDDCLNGPLVLQIQKIRNVSAPKANEKSQHAPQLLRLYLTDGCGSISVIQGENWSQLKLFDKAPGTKILIKTGSHIVKGPLLQLDSNNFTLLGGKVDELIEKWKIKVSMSHRIRSACGDVGPPPWVPFGQKIDYTLGKGPKGFKSLDANDKETVKEQQAFDEQRKATIAEISKSKEGVKKVFGKGKQEVKSQPTDTRRRDNRAPNGEVRTSNSFSERPERKPRSNFRKDRGDRDEEEQLTAPSKPSTIFDFLETKLIDVVPSINQNTPKETPKAQDYNDGYQEYETSYNQERGSYNNQRGGGRNRYEGSSGDGARNRNFQKGGNRGKDGDYGAGGNYGSRPAGRRNDFEERRSDRDRWNNRDQRSNPSGQSYSGRNDRGAQSTRNNNNDACPQPNPINFPELGSELVKEHDTRGAKKFTQSHSQQQQGSSFSKKTFAVGDHVLARYWEDRKFYAATIFATSEGNTCVVQFTEYGNYEEVLIDDVFVAGGNREQQRDTRRPTNHHQDSYNVPSSQHPRQSESQGHYQGGQRGGDRSAGEYNSDRRPRGGSGGYQQHNQQRRSDGGHSQQGQPPPQQHQQNQSSDNRGNKSRTYKPSLQYYQPPRQREQ